MLKNKKIQKERTGLVVSDKMNKTIVVRVSRLTTHATFKKIVRRFKKLKAHDEKNSAKNGDTVVIGETRPISKGKRWRLLKIKEKAK